MRQCRVLVSARLTILRVELEPAFHFVGNRLVILGVAFQFRGTTDDAHVQFRGFRRPAKAQAPHVIWECGP